MDFPSRPEACGSRNGSAKVQQILILPNFLLLFLEKKFDMIY